jgi:hypothetical protein
MPLALTATLKRALRQLEAEKAKIDRQIAAIQVVLQGASTPPVAKRPRKTAVPNKPPRTMSPKARKAARERMKAYWAKKKAEKGKAKP